MGSKVVLGQGVWAGGLSIKNISMNTLILLFVCLLTNYFFCYILYTLLFPSVLSVAHAHHKLTDDECLLMDGLKKNKNATNVYTNCYNGSRYILHHMLIYLGGGQVTSMCWRNRELGSKNRKMNTQPAVVML